MAKKTDLRTFNISVIGLSGTEKDKGQVGVGKSCLCNRFICPSEDHYKKDHISVLSQSDFGGRVINNDHFLYWGKVTKMDEGSNFTFNVIEQTEFIDDVSFAAFKAGRTDLYTKRCVQTKVQSAEKLMYICKDQLGMETDSCFEQKVMPDGKLHIDGFLCCFDVSEVTDRSIEKQVEFCSKLLNNAMKTKKPVVLVTTKNDELKEEYLKEVEKLLMRKEYKSNNLQLVETSAHENINVEAAFLVLAHLMDKSKPRKITPFNEAQKARNELRKVAQDAFKNLLRLKITDSKISWKSAQEKLEKESEFKLFVELFNTDKARIEVKRHTDNLREELIKQKQNKFMQRLPYLLQHFLPDLETIGERADWLACQTKIMQNKDFGLYFKKVCEDGKSWKNSDFVNELQDSHLPVDILTTTEAESCFLNHVSELQAVHRKEQLKQEFRASLEKNVDIPGGALTDYYQLFMEKECFTGLEEHERKLVFDDFQKQLKQRLQTDIHELLWERPSVFYNLNLDPKVILTEEDFNIIFNSLNDDQRFRKFYKLEDDRRVMLLNHVVFLEKPSVDQCVFHSLTSSCKCTECKVSRMLKERHCVLNGRAPPPQDSGPLVQPLNLLILGKDNLAAELHNEIQGMCIDHKYKVAHRVYSLKYRVINGNVKDHNNALVTPNFKPHGCVCIYNSAESLEYIRSSLLTTFESNQSSEVVQVLVVMLAYEPYSQRECENLTENGKLLASSLQCKFVDIPAEDLVEKLKFYPKQIEEALKTIIGASEQTVRDKFMEDTEPDLRLLICMMCSDPYPMEIPIQPFLNDNSFVVMSDSETSSVNSRKDIVFSIDATIHNTKQKVKVTVTSYHGGHHLLKKHHFYHGYILVYCPQRHASLFSVKALACAIEAHGGGCLLFLAVPEGGGSQYGTNDQGLKDGQELAKMKSASFMQTNSDFRRQGAIKVYDKFICDAWDQKEKLANICNGHQDSMPPDHEDASIHRVPISVPTIVSDHTEMPPDHEDASIHRVPISLPTIVSDHTENHCSSNSPSTEEEPEEPLFDEPSLPEPPAEPQHPNPSPPLLPHSSPSPVEPVFSYRNNFALVKPSMLKARRDEYAELPSDNSVHDNNNGQIIRSQNDVYDKHVFTSRSKVFKKTAIYEQCVRPQQSSSAKKDNTYPPPAKPVQIGLSADYGTVKDVTVSENDYANVDDVFPNSRIIHIKSNKDENGSESVDESEHSTLEQDKDIYSKVNCEPAPHKTSHEHQNDEQMNAEHIRRASDIGHERDRSHSPSQDSTGSRVSIRTNIKSPGSHTHLSDSDIVSISSQLGLVSMNEDDDMLSVSSVSIHTVGSEYNDLELPESGNLNTLSKKKAGKDPAKTLERNKDKERKRQREIEKKQKEQQKSQKKSKKKDKTASPSESGPSLGDFAMSPNNPFLPKFIEKCVEFIEAEGLHMEGIYRIPGNKPQAESLRTKFAEDTIEDIRRDEIPLNAVATALKDAFAHLAYPLVPVSLYEELMLASERTKEFNNQGEQKKKERALVLRRVFLKMPPLNFEVLKFLVTHLNKVSQNYAKNSMTSTNLSVCWWPTLFRMEWDTFEKMSEFSRIPIEILSTLIEQCNSVFHSGYGILD